MKNMIKLKEFFKMKKRIVGTMEAFGQLFLSVTALSVMCILGAGGDDGELDSTWSLQL